MPSKLCPHSLNAHPDLIEFVKAGSPLVKLATFFGPAEELLALNPNLTIIGRIYEPYDANGEARSGRSPEDAARALVERQKEQYRLNPAIKIWEGPNEPVFGNAEDPANVRAMAWYAAFEAERLRLLADLGLRGVVGNFSTGNPDLPMWPAFLPAVAAAETFNGYLGLHEYSSPWMWWLTGNYQTKNCDNNSNFAGGEGDTGFVTLRYRKVYRNYLIPNGLGDVPLVMTECGLDAIGAVCPGQTSGAWKTHPDFWKQHDGQSDPIDYWRGPERDSERYYAEQLIWYDRELQKDSYVAGATIFTVGNTGNWQHFEIAGTRVTQYLTDYIRSQRNVPAPASASTVQPAAQPIPPTPAPTPKPEAAASTPPPVGNQLTNGGFESSGGSSGALGWLPWWKEEPRPGDGTYNYAFKPSWNTESLSRGAAKAAVYAENSSQRIINNWDPWHAGVKQTVKVPAGSRVRLTAYARCWASSQNWPAPSDQMVKASFQVGIEPNGGSDPFASTVVWSGSITPHDAWLPASVEATVGTGGQVGVFLSANFRGYSRQFLASFWDEASLVVVQSAPQPTPAPVEPTPVPAGTTIKVPPGPEPVTPRAPTAPSLLSNTSFEEGQAYFYDNTRELAVPAGWAFSFYDETTPSLPQQTVPFGRPVTALINRASVAAADRDRVFVGGTYCWKIGMTTAPVWVRLFQGVAGVEIGKRYRLTLNILPDLIVLTHPQIAYAADPLAGEVRLICGFPEQTFDTGWKTGRDAPFGKYTRLALDFIAPSDRVEVAIEVRSRSAFPSGAWYIDELNLSAA
jgi:hypothetical protein